MNDKIKEIEKITFSSYGQKAESFWENTKDHDVNQNYNAFFAPFTVKLGLDIFYFGCGSVRDILYFKSLGHNPVGLDGTLEFCEMARQQTGCPILHKSFNNLDIEENSFDGVFANAYMFHIPSENLDKVLKDIGKSLKPGGILFTSNPRGDEEGWYSPERYGNFMQLDQSTEYLESAGFTVLDPY